MSSASSPTQAAVAVAAAAAAAAHLNGTSEYISMSNSTIFESTLYFLFVRFWISFRFLGVVFGVFGRILRIFIVRQMLDSSRKGCFQDQFFICS